MKLLRDLTPSARRRARAQRLKSKLRAEHPLNGNCPVVETTGDGHSIGRCDFALRGTFCPRHGDLSGDLHPDPAGGWRRIAPEKYADLRDRAPAPEGLF